MKYVHLFLHYFSLDPDLVKPKLIKLVFVASWLKTHHYSREEVCENWQQNTENLPNNYKCIYPIVIKHKKTIHLFNKKLKAK
jgi:hypothetical protein